MPKRKINVALIGSGFMGRAHSNGLRQANSFFDLPVEPVLKVLGARNPLTGAKVAGAFGWQEVVSDWRRILERPDIDVVDIGTPVHTHSEIAIAALEAGKAVICEKPLSASLDEALTMAHAAESAGLPNMCTYNMRAVPAIAFARKLIQDGKIGQVNQWRAAFMQSWLVNPDFPLTWRLRKETAGAGALADLGSHSIDMARFLVGEIESLTAIMHTFTQERPIPLVDSGRASVASEELGAVTVDDSVWSMFRFSGGAVGTMEATRMATGRLCANRFEVFGSRGALAFDFMRMNELEFYSLDDPAEEQGWRNINVTAPDHPFLQAWWPKGHPLGYEHSFPNLFSDFFSAYARGEMPEPSFRDAARTQAVLDALERSSDDLTWVDIPTF
jgi:predicted dehydrogenase